MIKVKATLFLILGIILSPSVCILEANAESPLNAQSVDVKYYAGGYSINGVHFDNRADVYVGKSYLTMTPQEREEYIKESERQAAEEALWAREQQEASDLKKLQAANLPLPAGNRIANTDNAEMNAFKYNSPCGLVTQPGNKAVENVASTSQWETE